jgi:2-methylisocitrate lyase-like PEP mutase family enzyme
MGAKEQRSRLRFLMESDDIVIAPGASDPLTVLLLQSVGYDAVHVSGSIAHRTSGYADAGILTMHEMVDRITAMSDVTDLPLIADADTGFGGIINVIRTIKEYERAGAAAIHIEDQLTPKRPTHMGMEGAFISDQEMVDKIRAAVDTRIDNNFLIIARCDIPDQGQKLQRLQACIEAGADVAWLSGRNKTDITYFTAGIGNTPSLGVLPRGMILSEYQDAGASCAVLPGILQIAALTAQRALLEDLKLSGTPELFLANQPFGEEMARFYNQQGADELKRIEDTYSGSG